MNEPLKRILFVDDEKNVLDGLRRMLRGMRGEWKMEFVNKPADALVAMEANPYDVIVSDLRMPEMDGLQLLEIVRERFPETIRFMLSGYTDQPLQSRAARCVHQFVSKPCDTEQLRMLLTRAFTLYDRLHSREVLTILARIRSLPVLPKIYQEVIDLLNKPTCSLRQIGQAISQDIGMSSKILQVVNSTFYGQGSRIVDPVHAVSYLGQKSAEALILTSGVFAELSPKTARRFCVDGLQGHSLRVGGLAREIAGSLQLPQDVVDTAGMAGILHDAGKMILMSSFAEEYAEAIAESRRTGVPLVELERRRFTITHAELGGCLLDLWGLPNEIIEAVTFHHEPGIAATREFAVVSAVHIADAIDHDLCCPLGDGCSMGCSAPYLDALGVADRVDAWRRMHLGLEDGELQHAAAATT